MAISFSAIAKELTTLVKLASPILIGQLAQMGMGVVDTIMAGHLSANDLAAVALGTSIWIPINLFMIGVLMATTPAVAHLFGNNQNHTIRNTLHQALWLASLMGAMAWLLFRFSPHLLPLMHIDPHLYPIAHDYLLALSWGMPAVAFYMVLRCFCDALNHTLPNMVISLLGLLLNIPFNYVLIYGKFGFPALGAVGCGWASMAVMWLMLFFMLGYLLIAPHFKKFNLTTAVSWPQKKAIYHLLTVGLPIGFSIFFEISVFSVIALLLGSLGAEVIASHQVALNFSSLIFMLPLSISMALTIRVGQAAGQQDREAARFTCQVGMGLIAGLALLLSLAMIFSRHLITALYTHDSDVQNLAAHLLLYAAVFQLSDGIQAACNGALRGLKDTKTPMVITLIAYWCIGLPIGYSLGLTPLFSLQPLGAEGFWLGLVIGLSVAAILLGYRLIHCFSPRSPYFL